VTTQSITTQRYFTPARVAVSMLFFQNGYLVGNWAPKVPEFAYRLGLSDSGVGLMVLFFGLGSLIAMPLVGWQISRIGSPSLARWLAAISVAVYLAISVAPNVVVAALILLAFGAAVGGTDVAMNANAVEVERSERRAIMSSCHGFWSLGGFVGAATGGALIGSVGGIIHAVVSAAVCAVLIVLAWQYLFVDRPQPANNGENTKPESQAPVFRSPTLWLMGLMSLIAMNSEGAMIDWGALYLRSELGSGATLSGFAYGAFSAGMAFMRFFGDGIRNRFGAVKTVRISVLVGAAGLVFAGSAGSAEVAVAGFALAGLGLANIVPILFSAAGNLPNLPKGVGISFVSVFGYSGILFAPALIGFISEHTGLALIFTTLGVSGLVLLAGSNLARHADRG